MRSMQIIVASAFMIMCAFCNAQTITLTPDKALEIRFSLSGPAPYSLDLLGLNLYRTTSVGSTSLTAALYDGDSLLGTHVNSSMGVNRFFAFGSAGSVLTFGNPPVVDLGSVLDGTIDGLLRITLSDGSRIIDPTDSSFYLGKSVTGNSYSVRELLVMSDVSLVPRAVPLPPAIWLFGSGLIGLIGIAKKRKT